MNRGVPSTPDPQGWGTQNAEASWEPNDISVRPITSQGPPQCLRDVTGYGDRPLGLWRFSAYATPAQPVHLSISYSAGKCNGKIDNVLLPLVAYVPGSFSAQAIPIGAPTTKFAVFCQVTPVTDASHQKVNTLLDATAGALPIPATGVAVRALNASTVTPYGAGAPIALAAGARLEIVGPTVLATGVVIVEHEL